jgi:hypothetical protein
MLLHIANFEDAPRRTATAGSAIPMGAVTVASSVAGVRILNPVANAQAALLVPGNYGVALKVSKLMLQVTSVTGSIPADFGSRLTAIVAGDSIVEVGRGAILEYDVSQLHASLAPTRAGTLPVAGTALAIVGGLFCTVATASAIVTPVIGRVFDVVGGKVRVELV